MHNVQLSVVSYQFESTILLPYYFTILLLNNLGCCKKHLLQRPNSLSQYSLPSLTHSHENVLGQRVSLPRGFFKPLYGLSVILGHPFTTSIAKS